MRHVCLLLALTLAPALAVPVAAQDGAPSTDQAGTVTDADRAFGSIQRGFLNLYNSFQARGGIREEDRQYLVALRDRIATFRGEHPGHVPAIAMEYQIARWLKDDERADALLIELIAARPDDLELLRFQAERLRRENRYAEAMALLQGHESDLTDDVDGALLLSNVLFAQERFAESLSVLEAVDEEASSTSAFAKSRLDQDLKTRLDYAGFWEQEQQLRAVELDANDLPQAEIVLDRGRIVVELFENEAPNTVANFISLAESGFYDGTTFHRVMPNFMIQGGDPNSREGATGAPGSGNPGYYIADEHTTDAARRHFTASLAMAKQTAPNTAGCQFYLSHEPLPHLNGMHTVFGRTLDGSELVRTIEKGDVIQRITILRKRDHAYEPETLPLPPGTPGPTPAVGSIGSPPDDGAEATDEPETAGETDDDGGASTGESGDGG